LDPKELTLKDQCSSVITSTASLDAHQTSEGYGNHQVARMNIKLVLSISSPELLAWIWTASIWDCYRHSV